MVAHYEVLKEEFVPLATVKKVLKKRNKSDLTYEQKLSLENAEEFARVSETQANKIVSELRKIDLRKLKDDFIISIANLVPKSVDELKLILNPSKISFKDEELNQLLDIVKENIK
ncbi:MAG TPA: hypothetical protein VI790_03325 [Candidatus Nanoarchaeia archaeon]|nr:hypothetical protein [Candidatus Nanoarchaeia archaeon]